MKEKKYDQRGGKTYKLSDWQKIAWQDVMWFADIAKDKQSLDGIERKTCFFSASCKGSLMPVSTRR